MTNEGNKLTFIGKAKIDDHENDLLHLFGRALWRMAVELTVVPKGEANLAVVSGVEAENGVCRKIENQALKAPRDGLVVYADSGLLAAIKKSDTSIDLDRDAVVIENADDLQEYVEALLADIFKRELMHKESEPGG